jgi:ketosteroid isomerase-like protein
MALRGDPARGSSISYSIFVKSYHLAHVARGGSDAGMAASHRTPFLAAAASLTLACSSPSHSSAAAALAARSEQANDALMRGDSVGYNELVVLGDDFTLMSPFGGTPRHGAPSPEQWREIGRFFKHGALRHELVQAYATADMIVLAVIEHAQHVEVGGLAAQDWSLRVTLVYRRATSGDWQLVHRHADPLAHGITVEQAAALGRGVAIAGHS